MDSMRKSQILKTYETYFYYGLLRLLLLTLTLYFLLENGRLFFLRIVSLDRFSTKNNLTKFKPLKNFRGAVFGLLNVIGERVTNHLKRIKGA